METAILITAVVVGLIVYHSVNKHYSKIFAEREKILEETKRDLKKNYQYYESQEAKNFKKTCGILVSEVLKKNDTLHYHSVEEIVELLSKHHILTSFSAIDQNTMESLPSYIKRAIALEDVEIYMKKNNVVWIDERGPWLILSDADTLLLLEKASSIEDFVNYLCINHPNFLCKDGTKLPSSQIFAEVFSDFYKSICEEDFIKKCHNYNVITAAFLYAICESTLRKRELNLTENLAGIKQFLANIIPPNKKLLFRQCITIFHNVAHGTLSPHGNWYPSGLYPDTATEWEFLRIYDCYGDLLCFPQYIENYTTNLHLYTTNRLFYNNLKELHDSCLVLFLNELETI